MKPLYAPLPYLLLVLGLTAPSQSAVAQSTAFPYQGLLSLSDTAADGPHDMTFTLYNAPTSGGVIASFPASSVPVSGGLFTVSLDFGAGVFDGTDYWMEIAVRPAGTGNYTVLQPRQPLSATPYASYAAQAGQVPEGSIVNPLFLGNTGTDTLNLQVANQPALRLEADPSPAPGDLHSFNLIGGYSGNVASPGVRGATIGGGGSADTFGLPLFELANAVTGHFGTIAGGLGHSAASTSFVGGGLLNDAHAQGSVIAGGVSNQVQQSAVQSTISGGLQQRIETGSQQATIAGGFANLIEFDGHHNAIGGGAFNIVAERATDGVIAGGRDNLVLTDTFAAVIGGGNNNINGGDRSVISGGTDNTIDTVADGSAISGGIGNTIGLATQNSIIGGGAGNEIGATGDGIVISGGSENLVGQDIFRATIAGGQGNQIIEGANNGFIGSGIANMLRGTAAAAVVAGGFRNTNSGSYASIPGGYENAASGRASFAGGTRAKALHAGSFVWADGTGANLLTTATNQFLARASGGLKLYSDATMTFGVELLPGEGAFSSLSDRNLKENFAPIDGEQVLDRVQELPIQTWNYRSGGEPIRHIGPMAQDFHAAFGVGPDARHIATVDADGVALAAIQGLHARMNRALEAKDAEIAELRTSLAALQQLVDQLLKPSNPPTP